MKYGIMKKIFYNGTIITLESKQAEAVLVEDKIINKVGSKDEIFRLADESTEIIDLKRKNFDAFFYRLP